MPIPVTLEAYKASEHLQESADRVVERQVRPIGAWRFLTPLDRIRVGDLYRCIFVDEPQEDDDGYHLAFRFGWSPVHKGCSMIDEPYQGEEMQQYEIIRALDESGTYEDMFELPEVISS